MVSKPGPKKRPRARKMLARFEYEWVRSRSALNETQLDIEYAREKDGSRLGVGDIRCVFRHARVRGKPFSQDVLLRLDSDPLMVGIGACARSVFWELLENPPVTRVQASKLVRKALKCLCPGRFVASETESCGLLDAYKSESDHSEGWEEIDVTRKCVKQLIAENQHSLDLIALFGCLSREAWFSFQPNEANYFGIQFWILLQDFLSQRGMENLEGVLDDYAVDRVVYWRDEVKCGTAWLPFGDEKLPDCLVLESHILSIS